MEGPKKSGVDSVLGDDTFFKGQIHSRGALRIDGRVEGEIIAEDSVVVGPSGLVKSDINASSVSVSGRVVGAILAVDKVEIHKTAVVTGDITTTVGGLTVESGARIDGRCTMKSEKLTLKLPPSESGAPTPAPASGATASPGGSPVAPSRPTIAGSGSTPPKPKTS